jgi:cytochrome c553
MVRPNPGLQPEYGPTYHWRLPAVKFGWREALFLIIIAGVMLRVRVHCCGLLGWLWCGWIGGGGSPLGAQEPPRMGSVTTLTAPMPPPPLDLTNRAAAGATTAPALVWDALAKEYEAATNETAAHFTFSVTNVSAAEVLIVGLRPSCGCTVAQMPATPWRLAPGASGQIQATTDLRGKHGVLNKLITVESSAGRQLLRLKITVPVGTPPGLGQDSRGRNLGMAMADRQAVFRGECARCHVEPAAGKSGPALFAAACDICHDSPQRASMVPELTPRPTPFPANYWRHWITHGRGGSLMPAFAQTEGGPLTGEQIESLVQYLSTRKPPASAHSPSADDRL